MDLVVGCYNGHEKTAVWYRDISRYHELEYCILIPLWNSTRSKVAYGCARTIRNGAKVRWTANCRSVTRTQMCAMGLSFTPPRPQAARAPGGGQSARPGEREQDGGHSQA